MTNQKKPGGFEQAYHALERLEIGDITEEAIAELRRGLNGKTSLLVSKAADIAGGKGLRDLIPEMISAFSRFMVDGAKTDKQCAAKISIANALNALEHTGDEVFLAGARYVQAEPTFGKKPMDTAIKLRCACAYGLARIQHPDAHYILTDLLVDPTYGVQLTDDQADAEYEVRTAAVKSLAYMGTPEAEVLLRFKVLTGDKEPEIISECFSGLMTMAPTRSLDFVARYLEMGGPAIRECAALAIGGSRLPEAFETLRRCWEENLLPDLRRTLILPIALLRTDDAFDFLLGVVRSADRNTAGQTLSALSMYADEDSVRKIREAVKAKGDAEITRRFEQEFGRLD